MNENINLRIILKNCPEGTEFYSKLHGKVTFRYIRNNYKFPSSKYPIVVKCMSYNYIYEDIDFADNGKFLNDFDGECILVPSKEQQDWNLFKAPWYENEDLK